MYVMPLKCALKIAKIINFMLCIFYTYIYILYMYSIYIYTYAEVGKILLGKKKNRLGEN